MLQEAVAVAEPVEGQEDLIGLLPTLSRGSSQCETQATAVPLSQSIPIPSDDPNPEEIAVPNSDTAYNTALRDLRFSSYDFQASAPNPPSLNTARVLKEVKSLARDLPCDSSASIYVRMDKDNMGYFQAIISGTPETPYSYGLYLFDIRLPEDYPCSPPNMSILTTGNGNIRFNPNLYAEGYMCLSILNTWGSTPEEMWSPAGYSTIMQVLISVQSLIMDQNVLQKEPGYEEYTTESEGNLLYRDIVRYNNMKWAMTDMIKRPNPAFAEVIHAHFTLLRKDILKTGLKWVEETQEDNPEDQEGLISAHNPSTLQEFHTKGRQTCMKEAYKALEEALASLS